MPVLRAALAICDGIDLTSMNPSLSYISALIFWRADRMICPENLRTLSRIKEWWNHLGTLRPTRCSNMCPIHLVSKLPYLAHSTNNECFLSNFHNNRRIPLCLLWYSIARPAWGSPCWWCRATDELVDTPKGVSWKTLICRSFLWSVRKCTSIRIYVTTT